MTDDAPPTAPDEAPKPDGASPGHEGGDPHTPEHAATVPAPDASVPKPAAEPVASAAPAEPAYRPNYVFLVAVALVTLVLDLGSKAWAKSRLEDPKAFADRTIEVVKDHLAFRFARNQGGAWGLFQDQPESIRRPFFLGISFLAIAFIVSLYRKLTPPQWALKWGLPLVLGGALGNLVNRIQYNYVAIVAGVILMAVDMFTPRKSAAKIEEAAPASIATAPSSEAAAPAPLGDTPAEPPAPPAPKET